MKNFSRRQQGQGGAPFKSPSKRPLKTSLLDNCLVEVDIEPAGCSICDTRGVALAGEGLSTRVLHATIEDACECSAL